VEQAVRLLRATRAATAAEHNLAGALVGQVAAGVLAYPEAVLLLPATLVTVLEQLVADARLKGPVDWERSEWVALLTAWQAQQREREP
jgi:hypothetical protein